MDLRQEITDSIIQAIENGGIPPWRKGWVMDTPHFNCSSGAAYRGINQVVLMMQPYTDARWISYRQAEHMGLQVRKGAKGVRIVKMVEVDRNRARAAAGQDGEVLAQDDKKALVMKSYVVFNASQVDGLAPMPERQTDIRPAEAVEAVIFGLQEETGGRLKLNFGGNQPAYYARTDEIRIPPASQFLSIEDFHATLLHEAIHASGHPKRTARLHLDATMSHAERAREELVAELGAALTLASIGLPPSPSCMASHAAYIASWLEVLRQDKQEIFRAAAQAQKACDYLQQVALVAAPLPSNKETATEPEPEAAVVMPVSRARLAPSP